jgi:hypothetical protein
MHVHLGAKRHQLTIDLITRRLLGATTEKINLAFSCFFTFDGHVIMHVRHGNVFFHCRKMRNLKDESELLAAE